MRVLMITRRVDRTDWLAGFAHAWIGALARHPRVERVEVLCLELGEHDLPPNVGVRSMGKERGYGRLRELIEAQRALASLIRRVDVVFAHIIPRYALIAAPLAKLAGRPIVLWYTHRGVSAELRLAHAIAARVVTASPESYNLPGDKVRVIGHGIDISHFQPGGALPDTQAGRLILAVGRLSPIKHYDRLIAGFARLAARPGFEDVRLAIAGGSTPQHPAYRDALEGLAADLGVGERVSLLGPVPPQEMPALYRSAALTANLCPTGGLDKVVIESLASGVPAVVHNRTFLPVLGEDASLLWCDSPAPEMVADRLAAVLTMPAEERAVLGARLAGRVWAEYDLDGLIDRLVGVFEEVAGPRGRRER